MGKYLLIIRTKDDAFGFPLDLPSDVISVQVDYCYREIHSGEVVPTRFENLNIMDVLNPFLKKDS